MIIIKKGVKYRKIWTKIGFIIIIIITERIFTPIYIVFFNELVNKIFMPPELTRDTQDFTIV